MISEFIDYCRELFPTIDPYTEQQTKRALDQFFKEGRNYSFTESTNVEGMTQGDVFDKVPFSYTDVDGQVRAILAPGMLLTNTCDCTRNDNLEFACIFSISDFGFTESQITDLKNNKKYQFLYIPDNRTEEQIIDFGLISSVSRTAFSQLQEEERVRKCISLSAVGYYLFLAKLTVFFMRPESAEIIRG